MMDEKSARLYAQLDQFKYLVSKTERFIAWSLRQVKNPYVACSFGKDSSVMLHMILKHAPNIVVRFATHPETNILDDYPGVIEWWVKNYSIKLQEIYCDGGLVKVKHHQRKMLNEGNWDAFFVGIRAQESFGRRVSLKTYSKYHQLANGRIKICPMAWWKENDVSAYIFSKDLPLLGKYKFEGISARTSSGTPRTHIHETLQALKSRDLQKFNQLCDLFEDAKYYV
ncbi:MAG: phosphoadenosine phosphosulfate reductase family protein [Candidatus Marinimicrobia bacterium]|jgi:hypothetical protein|nr:phosphoadenosine phosphosulfate reductase family protein [Candidatus Neomarinimicrobiota bacterium]